MRAMPPPPHSRPGLDRAPGWVPKRERTDQGPPSTETMPQSSRETRPKSGRGGAPAARATGCGNAEPITLHPSRGSTPGSKQVPQENDELAQGSESCLSSSVTNTNNPSGRCGANQRSSAPAMWSDAGGPHSFVAAGCAGEGAYPTPRHEHPYPPDPLDKGHTFYGGHVCTTPGSK